MRRNFFIFPVLVAAFSVPLSAQAQIGDFFKRLGAAPAASAAGKEAEKSSEPRPLTLVSSAAAPAAAPSKSEAQPFLATITPAWTKRQQGAGVEHVARVKGHYVGCYFPEGDSATKAAIQRGTGLLLPVFKLPSRVSVKGAKDSGDTYKVDGIDLVPMVDWTATEELHARLSRDLRMNLAPMPEVRKAWGHFQNYLQGVFLSDLALYQTVGSSGGGIFGQLIGSLTNKDASFTRISDPNQRLSGILRPNFYAEVVEPTGKFDYLVTVNEPAMIQGMFYGLSAAFMMSNSVESLSLRIVKDMTPTIDEAMRASRYYYFGNIDEARAANSGVGSILASSLGSIRFKSNDRETSESYQKYMNFYQATTSTELLIESVQASIGQEISISLMEKYKQLNISGVDLDKVWCGSYDIDRTETILNAGEAMSAARSFAKTMSNPLVFATIADLFPNKQARDEHARAAAAAATELKTLLASADAAAARARQVLLSDALPTAFRAQGFTGAIASQRLK